MRHSILILSIILSISSIASAAETSHYSVGYRMGLLTKFSFKGTFVKSWNGQLQLGNNSSIAEGYTPWEFSVKVEDSDLVTKLQSMQGQFVVLKYVQDIVVVSRGTTYRIVDVEPVENQRKPTSCASQVLPTGQYSTGVRVGRVVKISDKGYFNHSWEVILQLGNSGNEFIAMSVYDDQMAECMIDFLKTGRRASVTYNQALFYDPTSHSTSYQILNVEPNSASLAQ